MIGTALRVMIHDDLPPSEDVEAKEVGDRQEHDGVISRRYLLGRKGAGEQVPAVGMCRANFNGTVVVWIDPAGKSSLFKGGQLVPEAATILDGGAGIFAVDVFDVGELALNKPPAVDATFAGYTFCYNKPLLAQRVHDILTAVAYVRGHEKTKQVDLVGFGEAGPWALLARGLCGDAVARTAADVNGFRFEKVKTTDDPMMLPGALKYGGLSALSALAVPGEVFTYNQHGTGMGRWMRAVYEAAGAADKFAANDRATALDSVKWLLR